MSQIKTENLVGLVRTETKKGDENREKPYVAIEKVGTDKNGREIHARRLVSADEAKSIENRLDKDRSRMERDGTREPERERERAIKNPVASREAQEAYLRNFHKKQH